MKKFISILLITFISLLTFCSCGETEQKSDGLSIVCTTFPQYDFVKNILGSDEGVTLLLENGGDLHSYEPTAQDIIKISQADLFIHIGGISDKWVESTLKAANNPNLKTIALMDYVETYEEEYVAGMEHNHADGNEHGTTDEHIWLSLKNARKMTAAICDALCNADSENAQKYRLNALNYISLLNELDGEYEEMISSAKRNVVLFADRFPFRYLIEDYSLEYYAAFAGCSSESEASFQTMAFLIDKTKELSLPVILTIDGSDGSLAKTVCDSTNSKSAMLNSCQSVSMTDIENGTSYLDIMKTNLEVLREALN